MHYRFDLSAQQHLFHTPTAFQVILVGALESVVIGVDGEHHFNGRPFREAEKCWHHLDYISLHEYHVIDEADVEFGPLRKPKPGQLRDWEVVRIRDAHVVVQRDPFMELVDKAMVAIRAQRGRDGTSDGRLKATGRNTSWLPRGDPAAKEEPTGDLEEPLQVER